MAGLATATVSDFINCAESIPISQEKRERIMEAMREANYRPSAASSSLRRNSALPGKAVFIYGDNPDGEALGLSSHPALAELLVSLSRRIRLALDLSMEVRTVENEDSLASWNECVADASAIVCYGRLDARLLEISTRRNIPLALISDCKELHFRDLKSAPPPLDYVYWDSASHLEKLLGHVVAKGARRLAFVSSWNLRANNPEGFAVEAEEKIREFENYLASARDVAGEILRPPRPENVLTHYEERNAFEFLGGVGLRRFDAILCHNDFIARGALEALQEQGLKAGKDALLCGEGDYVECRFCSPSITTISYDKLFLAERVCEILARRLKENRSLGEAFPVPSALVERESTEGGLA